MSRFIFAILCFLTPFPVFASGASHGLDPTQLDLIWGVPFVGMLLSLALMPIFAPHLWHGHYGKIAFGWGLATIIPVAATYGVDIAVYEILHTYLLEYIPFILVAVTLFTISGGIQIELACCGKPWLNTAFMIAATFIASWIGTTGAAMLFIRPLLAINSWRYHRTHIVIFFILLVCNLGGSLTALGDPPLFLGFLQGVSFFWPLTNLFKPFIVIVLPVFAMFFILDLYYYRQEDHHKKPDVSQITPAIKGKINFLLFLGVMTAVIISGYWKPGITFDIFHVNLELQNIMRDGFFILLTGMSLLLTPKSIREYNVFTWEPVLEVAKIFAVIFITAMPVISILEAGEAGALGKLVSLVSEGGVPLNRMYFWMTGILSAFLDNAPTYLVFFHMAGGNAAELMGPLSGTLIAISSGAVFMGALTYIGNAPNFMVKAIAEINHVPMPSFFGYMAWSLIILLPWFALISWLLF